MEGGKGGQGRTGQSCQSLSLPCPLAPSRASSSPCPLSVSGERQALGTPFCPYTSCLSAIPQPLGLSNTPVPPNLFLFWDKVVWWFGHKFGSPLPVFAQVYMAFGPPWGQGDLTSSLIVFLQKQLRFGSRGRRATGVRRERKVTTFYFWF